MQFEDVQKEALPDGIPSVGSAIHEGAGLRDLQRSIREV